MLSHWFYSVLYWCTGVIKQDIKKEEIKLVSFVDDNSMSKK